MHIWGSISTDISIPIISRSIFATEMFVGPAVALPYLLMWKMKNDGPRRSVECDVVRMGSVDGMTTND